MNHLPDSVKRLIDHFDALPGIGPKHAARLALYVLGDPAHASRFAQDMGAALASVKLCTKCQTITDGPLCNICKDPQRNQGIICVVAHVQDIDSVERTGKHRGVYHVLHGMINPIEGIGPDTIGTQELIQRIDAGGISEIILALDATSDGEATTLYITKLMKEHKVAVSRLARGIPVGSNIEYTDEVTLSSAFENRNTL